MASTPASVQDVLDLAPELEDAEADNSVRFALIVDTYAICFLVQPHWGNNFSEAHALVAAHFLTIEFNPGAVGGVVNARSIDKISESYSVGTFEDPEYQSTFYGRMYLAKQTALKAKQRAQIDAINPPIWCPPDDRRLP